VSDQAPAPGVAPEPVAPSFANGAGDGWLCPCGASRHQADAGRCARGHVAPRNDLARQTGIFARQQPADLQARVDDVVASILADLGDPAELSTLDREYVSKLRGVDVVVHLLADDIGRRGIVTPSGGVRRIVESFLMAIDRWDKLAQRIGTKRRQKVLDPMERVRQAVAEANRR
jgi:hypothetical protein